MDKNLQDICINKVTELLKSPNVVDQLNLPEHLEKKIINLKREELRYWDASYSNGKWTYYRGYN